LSGVAVNEDEENGIDGESDPDEAAYRAAAPADIPPVDFNLFVLSLNNAALGHMGEDASAASGVNLAMARHTIDMLCMLEEKTRGNLTGEEERLIHQVLFDLRMRFARKAKG
jgi:hypothetical protein